MIGLPTEAADALVMDAIFLVMSCVVTGEAEWFFGRGVVEGEVIEFLDEGESFEMVEGIYEVGFLFVYNGVGSSDVFEAAICLVGTVQSEEGAARLAVSKDRNF